MGHCRLNGSVVPFSCTAWNTRKDTLSVSIVSWGAAPAPADKVEEGAAVVDLNGDMVVPGRSERNEEDGVIGVEVGVDTEVEGAHDSLLWSSDFDPMTTTARYANLAALPRWLAGRFAGRMVSNTSCIEMIIKKAKKKKKEQNKAYRSWRCRPGGRGL